MTKPNYEYYTDVPINYMPEMPRYEPVMLSSSAKREYNFCPRAFFYSIVLGFKPKEWVPVFTWGTSYHLFREVLSRTYGYADDTPRKFDEEKAREAYKEAASTAIMYWIKNSQSTLNTKYDFMTVDRLSKTLLEGFMIWSRERKSGAITVLQVEQLLTVQLPDRHYVSARIDEIIDWNGRLWGRDFKTTSQSLDYYDKGLTPNDQFTRQTYIESKLSGRPVEGVIVDVMYNARPTKKDTKGPEGRRFLANRTEFELNTWERNEIQDRKTLAMYRAEDNYPMRESQCYSCKFRSVCKRPSEEAQLAQLKANFVVDPFDNSKSDLGESED